MKGLHRIHLISISYKRSLNTSGSIDLIKVEAKPFAVPTAHGCGAGRYNTRPTVDPKASYWHTEVKSLSSNDLKLPEPVI